MQVVDRYITHDNEEHATRKKAVDHCLENAHLALTKVLQSIGRADAYSMAGAIITEVHKNGHANLAKTVQYLIDTAVE